VEAGVTANEHAPALSRYGIPPPLVATLDTYLSLVAAWNERTNLTAARTVEDRVRVLVADVWRATPTVRSGSLIDVGSGNGSPGLVLALLRPDLMVTLLEPRNRRWAFLREAARRLGRDDIRVERVRCEDFRSQAQTVTVRAVGLDTTILAPLVEPGGDLLMFGGQPVVSNAFVTLETVRLDHTDLHVLRRRPTATAAVSRET
jgi:16S rRNA (guanine(527)-N(7))-methyltransferase RsmG